MALYPMVSLEKGVQQLTYAQITNSSSQFSISTINNGAIVLICGLLSGSSGYSGDGIEVITQDSGGSLGGYAIHSAIVKVTDNTKMVKTNATYSQNNSVFYIN